VNNYQDRETPISDYSAKTVLAQWGEIDALRMRVENAERELADLRIKMAGCSREYESLLDEARIYADRWKYGAEHGFPTRNRMRTTHEAGYMWYQNIDGLGGVVFDTPEEAIDAARKP
jgi:hypothetical protein